MTKPSHIFVTTSEGRSCPIAAGTASAPGAALLLVVAGKVYRLPLDSYVRRRLIAGDLLPCTRAGALVADVAAAAAPDEIAEVGDDGSVLPAPPPAPAALDPAPKLAPAPAAPVPPATLVKE